MIRHENPNILASTPNGQQANCKKQYRKLYASIVGLAAVLIVLATLIVPQSAGSPIELNLNYKAGEHMVYDSTNIVTNQMINASLSLPAITNTQSYNSTLTLYVIDSNTEKYTVNETIATSPDLFSLPLPPITLNISKASYFNNFMAPGGPLIFYNSSSNPAISAYLNQPTVKVGEVWKIPVNTGNTSLGLTGEVTLKFAGIQDITVPAGTFKTIRIEVTSSILSIHSDDSIIVSLKGMTLQLNGTSFIEQGTCRLIKADLTQLTTTNSPEIGSTSTIYTEKTLVKFTKL
jgi:hypothetical protein